jgi:hypothetical protein
MVNHASHLELHPSFQHGDKLVGGMAKILPRLTRWVYPEVAAESSGGPIGGNLRAIWFSHQEALR